MYIHQQLEKDTLIYDDFYIRIVLRIGGKTNECFSALWHAI